MNQYNAASFEYTKLTLIVILDNLLDNAIEAAAQADNDKKIIISLRYDRNILYINIFNTYESGIIINKGKYRAANKNKINRVFGLSSVEKAVEKYDGIIDISYTESLFLAKVLMYNTAIE